MSEFKMPSLGADMESAVLMEWKVKEGDPVTKGQVIAEVEKTTAGEVMVATVRQSDDYTMPRVPVSIPRLRLQLRPQCRRTGPPPAVSCRDRAAAPAAGCRRSAARRR